MIKKNKKAIAMSFNWIFAIIAGGFILFLAIYFAGQFIDTAEQESYTETAASLSVLLDPLETGLASGKANLINFNKESKIFFDCTEKLNPPFGKQYISFSDKTLSEEYREEGGKVPILNKYIFAEDVVEGKNIYAFSKPIYMPFKIADMSIVISATKKYCFYDAPEDIQEDLENLNLKSIIFMNSTSECEGIKVCFDTTGGCDIIVNELRKEVYNKKNKERVYYSGDLVYAAIFSSPDIYECNIKRLKSKFNELSKIYLEKIKIMERQGCLPTIGGKLSLLIDRDIRDSRDLDIFIRDVEEIDAVNRLSNSGCMLYYNENWGR